MDKIESQNQRRKRYTTQYFSNLKELFKEATNDCKDAIIEQIADSNGRTGTIGACSMANHK